MSDIFTSFFRYDSGVAQSFHEYYLQQSVAGNDVVFYTDYYPVSDIGRGLGFRLKIRVSRQDYYVNTDQYKFDNYGWFGNVSISQVFSYGKGYEASQQIQIQCHQDNYNIQMVMKQPHHTSHHKLTYLERF
ncbi:MAG: hypothetical protein CM15mV13_1220 [uncultured marine virus]|nr:MAG: hypothetical protein CM15mV13_1220 [uncultured marine virus]